jgi:hypothetical protein
LSFDVSGYNLYFATSLRIAQNPSGSVFAAFLQKSDGGLPCLIFMMLSVWLLF